MNYYIIGSVAKINYESFEVENEDYNFNLFIRNEFTKKGVPEKEFFKKIEPLELIQRNKRKRVTEVDFPISSGSLISEKAYKLLKEIRKIEFLPALYGEKTYYFLNCYNCFGFEVVNLKESIVNSKDVSAKVLMSKLQFNSDFCEDIFSFKELPSVIIVSENIKDILESNKIKGFVFRKIGYSLLDISKKELKKDVELIIYEFNRGGANQQILDFMKNEINLKTNNPYSFDFIIKKKDTISKDEILKTLI